MADSCRVRCADHIPQEAGSAQRTIRPTCARLLEVSQYGDGGSSLGGIPESIDALMKDEPEKGQKLLADFRRLNTTESKEERKKIAKAMAEQL